LINKSKALILPGVGSFKKGMDALRKKGFIKILKHKVEQGTPILGICLGMQLLFSFSEEFGVHKGLGLINGPVISLKSPKEVSIKGYRVPHVGWNEIKTPSFKNAFGGWDKSLLKFLKEKEDVYFVHSFYPGVVDKEYVVATTEYGNQEFCVVIKKIIFVELNFILRGVVM
jgi:glutamine amidotransferase